MKFKPKPKSKCDKKVAISLRINVDVLKLLQKYSNKFNLSRNELVIQCIDYAIARLNEHV